MTNSVDAQFVVDDAALVQWCETADAASHVALDTEFERQKTYFAELCLVQISALNSIICIDPLNGLDLAPLADYLSAPERTKVVHSARQDLEVMHFSGITVSDGLEDTQIAAALAGFADQIGYAELVHKLLDVTLDKSQTRTNWAQRPLTDLQLSYAADDVRYLGAAHEILIEKLDGLGRLPWLREDCTALVDIELIDPPVERAWQRVKGLTGLHDRAFSRGTALAAWRERTARERNLPRGWVVKDADLVALAMHDTQDGRALDAAISEQSALLRRSRDVIVEVLTDADRQPPPERPPVPGTAARQLAKHLAAKVRARAEELGIGAGVLMTRREMELVLCGQMPTRLVSGWRAHALQDVLADVAAGAPSAP
jgi:ribonuclease D